MTDTNFGFGQFGPSDTASHFNVLDFIVKQNIFKMATATLVKIVSVDTDKKTVVIQPLVNLLDGNSNASPHGTINAIPYITLQGGKNAVVITPEVDDIGLAIFADRDISAVKETKAAANPGSMRRFDMTDGLYIGGFLNGTPEQKIEFLSTGIKITDKNGKTLESSSTGWAMGGNLTVNGFIHSNGAVIAGFGTGDQVGLQTHTHPSNGSPPTPGS